MEETTINLTLTARDLANRHEPPADGCIAAVTVTAVDGTHVAFDVVTSPIAERLLKPLAGTPLTEDDTALPHMFYDRYELFETGNKPDGTETMIRIHLKPIKDGPTAVEWDFPNELEPDTIQGIYTIIGMLTGRS